MVLVLYRIRSPVIVTVTVIVLSLQPVYFYWNQSWNLSLDNAERVIKVPVVNVSDKKQDTTSVTINEYGERFSPEIRTQTSITSIKNKKLFQSYDNIIEVRYDANAADKEQYNTSQNNDEDGEMYTTEILTKSERIKIENKRAFESDEKIFTHFYVHIPKTAGNGMFRYLCKLISHVESAKKTLNETSLQRPCYEGDRQTKYFQQKYTESYKGVQCNMWLSEAPILSSMEHHHAYTIIRSPREHVISQYHHCKESHDHLKDDKLPSFDEWIDHHMRRLKTMKRGAHEMRWSAFHCYDPINMQSYYTNFWEHTNEAQLLNRFDIIGDMAQLGKSACAITIRYSGYVPPMCDCTDQNRRRQLRADFTDHGVQHHGATFNLTNEQSEKIAKLTQLDSLLYERSKNAFAVQVREIEGELDIILCDDPGNPSTWPKT